ncbi:hypothetical protein PR048_022434 [Dryococelus australis]|uniref:Uncharacterized protein n=1 Tax=Dryococelus australis TaxID=614101 RepID=A0ABQ9H186_9NEOP|nr:hypothetical protein PR048_022434 [Dryococelus australis]
MMDIAVGWWVFLKNSHILFSEASSYNSVSKYILESATLRDLITMNVEEFSWSRDWVALRRGLEAVLSNKSTVFKQLQHVKNNIHPLSTVGREGCNELAVLLMCAGLPSDTSDADGDGILHGAARSGHVYMAAALLDLGADIDARGSMGRSTPLIWATYSDHPETVRLLTERGAALNATNNEGNTALHIAARDGFLVTVKILVEAGANTRAIGKYNHTAFSLSKVKSYSAMITYLNKFPH